MDDDLAGCRLVQAVFRSSDVEVHAVHDGGAAIAHVARSPADVVLLDLHLGDESGLDVLKDLRKRTPDAPVLMLTAHRDVKTAVAAIHAGAFDYLTKPVDDEDLRAAVARALEVRTLRREVSSLRQQLNDDSLAAKMGPSAAVRHVVEQVHTVAASPFSVLVLGETGTGKELVAQALHHASDRRDRPFIAVDCGAIPELLLESELFGHERGAFTGADRKRPGRFQLANGGTFFLDEIGNLPLGLQAKLLRVLESRQVQPVGGTTPSRLDIRFVAATNHDLHERALSGAFRADLYFRLAQYTISLPALRDRPTDVGPLAQRFLDEVAIELRRPVRGLEAGALKALETYAWPGNVRELRNVVRQAVLRSTAARIDREVVQSLLRRSTLPSLDAKASALDGRPLREIAKDAARAAEREAICAALRATDGNKSRAARMLAVDYKTLHLKLAALGISARTYAKT